ncbi:MAG: hypothetical protein ABSA47_19740 [Verrucomicrobiota bacterium]|jgi:hypothetical protein
MKIIQKWVLILGVALAVSPACNKQLARTEHPTTTNSNSAGEIIGATNYQVAGKALGVNGEPALFFQVWIYRTKTNTPLSQVSHTDSEGNFVFKDVGPGPLIVEVFKTTPVSSPSGSRRVLPGDTNVVVQLEYHGLP